MDLEGELGDDSEIAAAAALERPQKIRVGLSIDGLQATVGGHEIGADEVVGSQPEASAR